MNKKAKRILENIYDVILNTPYASDAKAELKKDLKNHNVEVNLSGSIGIIRIQDKNGTRDLYEIRLYDKTGKNCSAESHYWR